MGWYIDYNLLDICNSPIRMGDMPMTPPALLFCFLSMRPIVVPIHRLGIPRSFNIYQAPWPRTRIQESFLRQSLPQIQTRTRRLGGCPRGRGERYCWTAAEQVRLGGMSGPVSLGGHLTVSKAYTS